MIKKKKKKKKKLCNIEHGSSLKQKKKARELKIKLYITTDNCSWYNYKLTNKIMSSRN